MEYKAKNNLEIENARIIFRNFEGLASEYNREGDRNFCVIIDDQKLAQQLIDEGWNVKALAPRDADEEIAHYIQVKVAFDKNPPIITMITRSGKKYLNEDTIKSLDKANIEGVDLIINPYTWTVSKKSGVKGYLRSMYVTIGEDRFAAKYADIPG